MGGKLALITNRKSYMSFRLVPKSATLNDLERRDGRYIALFHWIWWTHAFHHITASICGGIYSRVYCIL